MTCPASCIRGKTHVQVIVHKGFPLPAFVSWTFVNNSRRCVFWRKLNSIRIPYTYNINFTVCFIERTVLFFSARRTASATHPVDPSTRSQISCKSLYSIAHVRSPDNFLRRDTHYEADAEVTTSASQCPSWGSCQGCEHGQ
jgi:hypothetical protein